MSHQINIYKTPGSEIYFWSIIKVGGSTILRSRRPFSGPAEAVDAGAQYVARAVSVYNQFMKTGRIE